MSDKEFIEDKSECNDTIKNKLENEESVPCNSKTSDNSETIANSAGESVNNSGSLADGSFEPKIDAAPDENQSQTENTDEIEIPITSPPSALKIESGPSDSPEEEICSDSMSTESDAQQGKLEIQLGKDAKETSTIPPAIAEIAAREMEQFQRIIASSKSQPAEPAVLPLLSTSGLGFLASQYESSEDEDADSSSSSSDSAESIREVLPTQQIDSSYRNTVVEINSDSETESDSSSSDVEFVKEVIELEKMIEVDITEDDDFTGSKQKGPMRVKGELLLDDLPPIHELHITVPEKECSELGKVHSIVEQLVLVDSIPGTVALDLDTVLFLEKGQKVLGEVFDVLGQVSSPLYCVRFNSNKQITEKGIEVGQTVYIAPRTEHTHFIILKDMLQLRGSDASWENDIEPSEKHLDYSDDEQERSARRAYRNRDRGDEDVESSKRDRPSASPGLQRNESFTPRHQQTRHQNPRLPRTRNNGPREFYNNRFPHANYNTHQPPLGPYPRPFAYGPMNASWHSNFNQPPPYPFAYPAPMPPTMPFIPLSEAMQQPLFPPRPPHPQ